jgi:fatty-acyl-CoA synthase
MSVTKATSEWMFDELLQASGKGDLHVQRGDTLELWTRTRVLTWASRAATGLKRRGLERGDALACIVTNTPEILGAVFGAWLAGIRVVSLPLPSRGLPIDEYLRLLDRLSEMAGARLLVVEPRFTAMLDGLSTRVESSDDLPADGPSPLEPPGDDDVMFVQFSSGSTRQPAGCVLTAGAVAAQMRLLQEGLALDRSDRGVAWLPLSHDMGLFGGMMTFTISGASGLLTTPERFLASPRVWLDDCAGFGATITSGPNAALAAVTRVARRSPPAGPLQLRSLVTGGERIAPQTLRDVAEVLAPCGLDAGAITPAYGLAEATLAVTAGGPGEPARFAHFDLAGEATELVSVGRPLRGVECDIVDEDDDGFGEILVRSPSLASGYAGDDELTAERFVHGGVLTGDVGTIRDGELYVRGRNDDMLKIAARKLWAGEVEDALGSDPDLRAGNVVIVDVDDGGARRLVVVAELADAAADHEAVRRRVIARGRCDFGIPIDDCRFVERGSLPKTPSGKVQRFRARSLVESVGAQE